MCGIVIVNNNNSAAKDIYKALLYLQHRGEDAAGIISFDNSKNKINSKKGIGLVADVFQEKDFDSLSGCTALGHVRYSTIGSNSFLNIQPMVISGETICVALAHNGNIENYVEAKNELQSNSGTECESENDVEIFLKLLHHHFIVPLERVQLSGVLIDNVMIFQYLSAAVKIILNKLQGAYSVCGIVSSYGMFAFKDRFGIRPLHLSYSESMHSYMFSSETKVLQGLQTYRFVREVENGELVFIDKKNILHKERFHKKESIHACMFEWAYFCAPESVLYKQTVYDARINLGKCLAQKILKEQEERVFCEKIDLIAAIPDSGRIAAAKVSEVLQVPLREVLIKNRYVARSFILQNQTERNDVIKLKFGIVNSQVQGKNILLVDDSIVRGNTIRYIVGLLRASGVNKVFFASSTPPIRYPCFYGIDFPTSEELIAFNKTEDQIAKEIDVEKIFYLDQEDLCSSITNIITNTIDSSFRGNQFPTDGNISICNGCISGIYPYSISLQQDFLSNI